MTGFCDSLAYTVPSRYVVMGFYSKHIVCNIQIFSILLWFPYTVDTEAFIRETGFPVFHLLWNLYRTVPTMHLWQFEMIIKHCGVGHLNIGPVHSEQIRDENRITEYNFYCDTANLFLSISLSLRHKSSIDLQYTGPV